MKTRQFDGLLSPEERGVRHRSGGQARRLPIVFKAAIEVTASQSQDGVAARTVQNMLDCLQREPITVLQPASMTPEPTNRCVSAGSTGERYVGVSSRANARLENSDPK